MRGVYYWFYKQDNFTRDRSNAVRSYVKVVILKNALLGVLSPFKMFYIRLLRNRLLGRYYFWSSFPHLVSTLGYYTPL